jgi:transcriptional regulator with XRE-family HTH domain
MIRNVRVAMPGQRPGGDLLRAWRQSRGWDVTATAERLRGAAAANGDPAASQSSLEKMIYAWERGKYRITERYMLLYAAIVGVTPSELADGPAEPLTAEPRRGPSSHPDRTRQAPVSEGDVAVIRQMLDSLTRSDRQFGGGHALAYATDYLTDVIFPRLSAPGPALAVRDMHAAACEFALRLASMHADAGQHAESQRMLSSAFPLARETGEPAWIAWVLVRCGEQELDRDNPAQARAWTSSAVAMASACPPGARAFVTAKHALALAANRDTAGCERALGEAREAWTDAGGDGEPAWMRSYGIAHITHDEARSRLQIGQGHAAIASAGESLAARTLARPRGFAFAAMAAAALQARDIDRACAASRELILIASDGTSMRLAPVAIAVVRSLVPYRRIPAVQDVLDRARTARLPG